MVGLEQADVNVHWLYRLKVQSGEAVRMLAYL